MGSLSNLYISQSYQSLIHLGTNNTASATLIDLQDGLGNSIGVAVNINGDLFLSGSLTASLQQGYLYVGGANGKTTAFATSSLVTNINTGSFVTTSSFNAYIISNDQKVDSLIAATASYATTGANTFNGSQTINGEISASGFIYANFVATNVGVRAPYIEAGPSKELELIGDIMTNKGVSITNGLSVTGSLRVTQTFTASLQEGYVWVGDSAGRTTTVATSSLVTNINTGSLVTTSSFNSYTQSTNIRLNNLETTSASVNVSISNLNSTTASQAISITNLNSATSSYITESETASFARTNIDNNFSANQTFTNITATSASITYLTTLYETASVIYSSGSNQLGDELTDIQTLSGSVKVQGSLTVNGTPVLTSSVDISGLVTTASFNAYTQSNDQKVSSLETNSASVNTSITNINSTTQSVNISISNINSTTASLNTSVTNLNASSASQQVSIDALNQFTASQSTASIVNSITELNTFSASALVSISNLNASSASQQISIDNLNANSASVNTSITNLNSATASLFTSASLALVTASFSGNTLTFTKGDSSTFGIVLPDVSGSTINTGSLMLTGSIAGNILTFTKGDASTFSLTIPSATGSVFDTGSFATTGSNTFTGVNTFNERTNLQGINVYTGSASGIYIGDRTTFAPTTAGNVPGNQHTVVGQGALGQFGNGDLNAAFAANTLANLVSGSSNLAMGAFAGFQLVNGNTNTFIGDQAGNGMKGGDNNFFLGSSAGNNFRTGSYNIMIGLNTQGNLATGSGNLFIGNQGGTLIENNVDNQLSIKYGTDLTPRRLFFKSGSEAANLYLYGGLEIENTLTASLANGFTYVGNASGRTTLVATSSFGGGTTYINPTLNPYSGSLILVANTFTSSSFAHISASANGQVNLIFKNNNNTADTILSGSNNLFVNPAAPTAGFKRYVGGSGNIALNGSNVPQISSSMAFSPTMFNNYFGGNSFTSTMRGPISSSAWTISANNVLGTINIGSSAALNAEKLTGGLLMQGNSIAGTVNIIANQSALTGSTTTANNNNINGTVTLNLSSSALTFTGNTINDTGFILTNQFSSSSLGLGLPAANANTISGTGNSFLMTGSQLTSSLNFGMGFNQNFLFGNNNTLFSNASNARVSGSNNYASALATGLLGQRLIVSASSNSNDAASFGSVFVGRNNANDGIRNKTSDIVFAVGTGVSSSADTRKTGFLIDSGSNTSIEGTLRVSGSTTLSGSLYIQSGSTLPSATGSSILTWNPTTGQVSQSPIATLISSSFSVGAFNSTITQSGSAAVSQSMTFNNTDISNGVSIVSNSQITLANTGTYNIQFSAQLLAGTGADTIWIWLKKNGTNVSNTATKLVLRNNEADVAAWNFVVPATASDYFELVWQSLDGHATLLTEAAAGNYPAIPSIILTVTQVE